MNLIEILLLVFGGAFLWLAAHPFTTYPFSLWLLRRFSGAKHLQNVAGDASAFPDISILICAYNEENSIGNKLANCRRLAACYQSRVDVFVYCDGCTDRTVEIVQNSDAVIVNSESRSGKSVGMTKLARLAETDLLVFTDANVMLDDNALREIAIPFSDKQIGGVLGHLRYSNGEENDTAAVGAFYWHLDESIKDLESDTGSIPGGDGSLFAIRRELFRPVPPDIIDDFFTTMSVLCSGHRVAKAKKAVAVEKFSTSTEDEFRRKIRIACRNFNCNRHLFAEIMRLPPLDLYKYLSRRFFRWLIVFNLLFCALCWSALLLLRQNYVSLSAILLGVVVLTLACWRIKPLRKFFDLGAFFVAVGIGVIFSIRGERYQTWLPPQSARGSAESG
ncbi:glycosyltransferase [Rhodopirellula baltica]|uniref:Two-component system sensor histidine kinase/response regulator, hybrid ('one component system') n=1 Tax=Rhodopirellula baltica WH47 TaxID=991778 RepID=F2AWM9_RHOBT|nr:glycosyltransferase [Rhodopirellula baltica]EGF25963.1 two-component system sensor histidine kinase/response regulator, hybrid ('one component system') [Rhodopirellula baltica WH47]